MRRIFLCALVYLWVLLPGFAVEDDVDWMQTARVQRKVLLENDRPAELNKLDAQILTRMQRENFSSNEKRAARLLYYVISQKNYSSNHNIAAALKILYTSFSDKNYFLDTVNDFARDDFMANSYVLSTVLTGFQECIDIDEKKLFRSYRVLSPKIDLYLFQQTKIGASSVIVALISFLNSYFILVEEGKISSKYDDVVRYTCAKMGFPGQKASEFDKYEGAKELKRNYQFYLNN